MEIRLSPTQRSTYERLNGTLPAGSVFVLSGDAGMGKSTLLEALRRDLGATLLTMKDVIDALKDRHPLAIEDAFQALTLDALARNDVLLIDDLHLLVNVVAGCGMCFYPKNHLLEAPLTTLATYAAESGKKLIFATEGRAPDPIDVRGYHLPIEEFQVADYRSLCEAYLDSDAAEGLDYGKIHRFAPKLNAHQLAGACRWLRLSREVDTERFIDYLQRLKMVSNVRLEEVQEVDLHDLKGIDDILESLEAHVILPLENDQLAAELDLRPKRGVLLAGPPGTGKTTVGRALAHRLRSKFFLIDGTFITGTRNFYGEVHQVFEAAKQNAPCIIFIDDSDVIFESGGELGLYRYLLTMLDGLESESVGQICIIMTAMDVGNLPSALIRSGRIELWLETRLPDLAAREAILQQRMAALPSAFGEVDVAELAAASEELTGADLKRMVEDGKILFAHDRARGLPLRRTTDYFLSAIETVRANKETYAAAEAQARMRHPNRPSIFDMFGAMGAMAGGEDE
jgi:transitional endoplasmic reticulum ATPase